MANQLVGKLCRVSKSARIVNLFSCWSILLRPQLNSMRSIFHKQTRSQVTLLSMPFWTASFASCQLPVASYGLPVASFAIRHAILVIKFFGTKREREREVCRFCAKHSAGIQICSARQVTRSAHSIQMLLVPPRAAQRGEVTGGGGEGGVVKQLEESVGFQLSSTNKINH